MRAGGAETGRQGGHFVAVAVPDIKLVAESVEQWRTIGHVQDAGAVLAPGTEFHLAAEMMRHQLHSVANSQHRNA